MRTSIFVFVFVWAARLWAQPLPFDKGWVSGYFDSVQTGPSLYHANFVRFNSFGTVSVEKLWADIGFEATAAALVPFFSEPLYFTNGCWIADETGYAIFRGKNLNPGEISALACPKKGYIAPQGATWLQGQVFSHFLVHMGLRYDSLHRLRMGPLYYTEVDQTLGGLGGVKSKNNILVDADLGTFTTVRHGNGRAWWVLVAERGNEVWHTFLLFDNQFQEKPVQTFTMSRPRCEKQEATVMSRDGSRLATWGDCKVTLLDFDRCSGLLGNPQEIPTPVHWIPGGGLAFSPNGQYLYATSHNVLYRADLGAIPVKFDTMRFSFDPRLSSPYKVPGTTFHYLANGLDGKIYGDSPSRVTALHIIGQPDAPSRDNIDFKPKGLPLPFPNIRTMPNNPNYLLRDLPGSPCDTLGINPTNELGSETVINVYPNPASTHLFVKQVSDQGIQERRFKLFSPTGALCLEKILERGAAESKIELHLLPTGVYFWEIWQADGKKTRGKVFIE